MEYRLFIHEIELLRDYKRSRSNLANELELLEYEAQNVKGIQYDKEPSSPNPQSELYRLELIERMEHIEKQIDRTVWRIIDLQSRVYDNIQKMTGEGRNILIAKYGITLIEELNVVEFGDEKTYEQLCEEFHFAGTSSIWRKMRKAVEDIE